MTQVLELRALRVTAGAETADEAPFRLEVPALALGRADCVALTGASGCGKSTLLEVLALLRSPERAARFALRLDPERPSIDLTQPGDRAHLRRGPIGYVPQSGGVLPFLTARMQVEAVLHLAGQAASDTARQRLNRLSHALELDAHLGKRRTELSGGQRKRVALLTGLAVPRALLIADEPTAGLDAANAARVMQVLKRIAQQDQSAVLIATHDTEAARQAGFDIVAILGGHLAPRLAPDGQELRHG
ncbi:MAG: ATP-binding cassette domain-containing protein [Sphingomonadales bacterium]|nr:ATP-binding cassette domain-containing protein [Sphingomonadales bacterium]